MNFLIFVLFVVGAVLLAVLGMAYFNSYHDVNHNSKNRDASEDDAVDAAR